MSQISTRSPRRFKDLPTEIGIRILALTITDPDNLKLTTGTYRSVVRVCREMRILAQDAYLPHIPVVLVTLARFESFCALLDSHPSVRRRIRSVWFIGGIKATKERTLGLEILQKCPHISRIACNINLLKAFVEAPGEFAHHDLKDLTLVEPIIPWWDILRLPTARQLFGQLTRFRAVGGTAYDFNIDFTFASLTHLSFSCHSIKQLSGSKCDFDSTRFPVLRQIVPSVPYMQWRTMQATMLRTQGRGIDDRMDVIACPKKWKELDVWEEGRPGDRDFWDRAKTTEFVQRSRAFTEEVSYRDYWDPEIHGYGSD